MIKYLNKKLFYNNQQYSFEELAKFSDSTLAAIDDPYLQKVIQFSRDWLKGKETFNIQTSGSTGTPKVITISQEQMEYSAKLSGKILGLKADDTMLIVLSVDYIAGMMMLVRAFVLGLNAIIEKPKKNIIINNPFTQKIDFLSLVPMQAQELIYQETNDNFLNSLKVLLLGGASISQKLEEKLSTLKPAVYHSYGMTETVTHIALRRLNGKNKSDWFTPLPGVKIKKNRQDCLMIQSPLSHNEWLETKDIIELSPEGQFKVLGRRDNIINSGGVKIQAEKVEADIQKLLRVHKAGIYSELRFIVCGLPDKEYGEIVSLVLETDNIEISKSIEELIKQSPDFQKYEKPRIMRFLPRFVEAENAKVSRSKTIELLSKR